MPLTLPGMAPRTAPQPARSGLFIVLLLVMWPEYVAAPTRADDVKALCDFYLATGGPSWKCYSAGPYAGCTGWKTCRSNGTASSDPCDSDGEDKHWWVLNGNGKVAFKCTGKTGDHDREVTLLIVNQNELTGTIPDSIGGLRSLTWLSVERNKISGGIPRSIGLLQNMTSLQMGHNLLAGTLPTTMSELSQKLNIIELNDNRLTLSNWLPFDPFPLSVCKLASNNPACIQNGNCFSKTSLQCLPTLSLKSGEKGWDGCGNLRRFQNGCTMACEPGQFTSLDAAGCDVSSVLEFRKTCCPACAASTSSQVGWSTCCGAGEKYNQSLNVCIDCEIGKYSPALGATSCEMCAERTASSTTGRRAPCEMCASGKYEPSRGASSCADCAAGMYSQPAWSTCCRAGQLLVGNTSFCVCEEGWQPSDASMTKCKQCDTAFYKATQTNEFCIPCDANKQVLRPKSSCPWSLAPSNGGSSSTSCVCKPGRLWDNVSAACVSCPSNMICPGDKYAFPVSGYWRLHHVGFYRHVLRSCKPSTACLGSNVSSCNHDHCAVGYRQGSLQCARCDKNYTKMIHSGQCVFCDKVNIGAVVALVVAAGLFLMYLVRKTLRKASSMNMGIFTIVLNYGNAAALLNAEAAITHAVAGFLSLDGSQLTVYLCLTNFFEQFALTLCVPVMFIIVLGLMFSLLVGNGSRGAVRRSTQLVGPSTVVTESAAETDSQDTSLAAETDSQDTSLAAETDSQDTSLAAETDSQDTPWPLRFSQSCFFIVLYSCSTICRLCVPAFVCQPYIQGVSLLVMNPSIQCYTKEHEMLIAWAAPFLFLFCFLGPFVITGRMFEWRCTACLKPYISVDFLQESYKNERSINGGQTFFQQCQTNFEIVLLFRRICLIVISIVSQQLCISTNGVCEGRYMAFNVLLFVSVVVQAVLMPFKISAHNYLEIFSLTSNFVLLGLTSQSHDGFTGIMLDVLPGAVMSIFAIYAVHENVGKVYRCFCCSRRSSSSAAWPSLVSGALTQTPPDDADEVAHYITLADSADDADERHRSSRSILHDPLN